MGDLYPLDPIGSLQVSISVARKYSSEKIAHIAIVLNDQDVPLRNGTVLAVFGIELIHLKLGSHI